MPTTPLNKPHIANKPRPHSLKNPVKSDRSKINEVQTDQAHTLKLIRQLGRLPLNYTTRTLALFWEIITPIKNGEELTQARVRVIGSVQTTQTNVKHNCVVENEAGQRPGHVLLHVLLIISHNISHTI